MQLKNITCIRKRHCWHPVWITRFAWNIRDISRIILCHMTGISPVIYFMYLWFWNTGIVFLHCYKYPVLNMRVIVSRCRWVVPVAFLRWIWSTQWGMYIASTLFNLWLWYAWGSGVIYGPTLQQIQRLKISTSSNSKLRFCFMLSFVPGFVPCTFVMIIIP